MISLFSLLNEADDNVSPEVVYPLYIKVRNQVGWEDKKLIELREKYGFDPDYYDSVRTWIYSIHPEYLEQFYEDLIKISGGEIDEIKNSSKITPEFIYQSIKMDDNLFGNKHAEKTGKIRKILSKFGYFQNQWSDDIDQSNLLVFLKYLQEKDKLYDFWDELKMMKEIKNLSGSNLSAEDVNRMYNDLIRLFDNRTKVMKILRKYGFNTLQYDYVYQFFQKLSRVQLQAVSAEFQKLNKELDEAPQDFQSYLDNPNFNKDYGNEQKIQQTISIINDRIAKKKWTEYSDGSYVMKIDSLYVKYVPEGSQAYYKAQIALGYKPEAALSPDEKILYLYGHVNDNEIRHELTHYFDSKVIGTKQMAAQSKVRNNQIANTQGRERYELYYNAPEEFNAHWFEYIMPVVNKLFDDGNIPSLEQFTSFVKSNKDIDNFYDHLNDQNKERFNKRLGVYYQAMQQGRPQVDNGQIENPGFIGKLKQLFQKRAA